MQPWMKKEDCQFEEFCKAYLIVEGLGKLKGEAVPRPGITVAAEIRLHVMLNVICSDWSAVVIGLHCNGCMVRSNVSGGGGYNHDMQW